MWTVPSSLVVVRVKVELVGLLSSSSEVVSASLLVVDSDSDEESEVVVRKDVLEGVGVGESLGVVGVSMGVEVASSSSSSDVWVGTEVSGVVVGSSSVVGGVMEESDSEGSGSLVSEVVGPGDAVGMGDEFSGSPVSCCLLAIS